MVIPDEGPSNPPLPEDAGPNERKLYDIYGFSSVLVRMTADDWGTTSDTVSNLAGEVRTLMSKLRGAQQPWEGPAAESAYATLETLATQLDLRAEEITGIKRGLNKAAEAADTARQAYQTSVRAISTDVDRSGYEKTVPRQGGQPVPDGKVFDQAAYDAAVAAQREQREQQAATVLAAFRGDITSAAKEMPVEAQDNSVSITPGGGGGGGGGGSYPTGGGPSGGAYVAPSGGGGGYVSEWPPRNPPGHPPVVEPPVYYPPVEPPVEPPVVVVPPETEPPPGVDLDGGTGGTTTPTGPGSVDWAGTGNPGSAGGGGVGLGTGGGAVGGGMLAGGAAMLGKGMLGKMSGGALGAAGRGPLVAGTTSGAAGRGTTGAAGRGASTGGGRGVVGAGGQGAQARGGRGGSGVRGARAAGRYGVPKLGESSSRGGKGVVGAGSGAGGRGGRKGKDGQAEGVDSLTHEDEQTWFEGEDDATPPVWR